MLKSRLIVLLFLVLSLGAPSAIAQGFGEDDSYDPFADYSEFEASAEEEADIHFFKNGRFFNIALMMGGRTFTGTLSELTDPSLSFGFYLAYFFDIRSALQISYTHSDHNFSVPSRAATGFTGFDGNISMSNLAVHYKYYFNTANITRGFADLNPFLMGGVSITYRTINITSEDIVGKADPSGVELGAGIEVPIARNKMYLGFQALYHYVTFPDESSQFTDLQQDPSGITPDGDYVSVMMAVGINF